MAKRTRTASRGSDGSGKPKTVQRTYRFKTELFERLEEDCARRLANPKLVIEALIVRWLDAEPKEREAIALAHREQYGAGADED